MTEADSKRLAELEMREAARDVLFQYALGVDTRDFDLLRRVFAEDVVFDRPPADIQHGRDVAMAHYQSALPPEIDSMKHFITNPTIMSNGDDTVSVHAYIFAVNEMGGALSMAWGQYRMKVRVDTDGAVITEMGIYLDKPATPLRTMLGED